MRNGGCARNDGCIGLRVATRGAAAAPGGREVQGGPDRAPARGGGGSGVAEHGAVRWPVAGLGKPVDGHGG